MDESKVRGDELLEYGVREDLAVVEEEEVERCDEQSDINVEYDDACDDREEKGDREEDCGRRGMAFGACGLRSLRQPYLI